MKMNKTIITIASALALVGCSGAKNANNTTTSDPILEEVVEEDVMTGAYSEQRVPSEEEISLFKSTYKGEIELTPYSVSSQVVAGMNYAFTCKDKEDNTYRVVIYQPLPGQGEPEVTSTTITE